MAVDFSRALKVKSPTNGIVTYYGRTTVPSGHYIAFRSQGATRYIKLQLGNSSGGLQVRIADNKYYPYNIMEYRVHFSNTKESSGWWNIYKSKLTKIEYLYGIGGASLPASITIEYYNGDTQVATKTVTLNANTESQTYNEEVSIGLVVPKTIKITLTINGKSATATTDYVLSGTQSIYTYIIAAPW